MNRNLTGFPLEQSSFHCWTFLKRGHARFLISEAMPSKLPLPLSCWKLPGRLFLCPALLISTSRPQGCGITSHLLLPGTSLTKPPPPSPSPPPPSLDWFPGCRPGLGCCPHLLTCAVPKETLTSLLLLSAQVSTFLLCFPSLKPSSKLWPHSPAL